MLIEKPELLLWILKVVPMQFPEFSWGVVDSALQIKRSC